MTALAGALTLSSHVLASESYGELLRSGPHWLFELTLELLTAPLAFALSLLWRNGLLRRLHRDLHAVTHDLPRCVEPTSSRPIAPVPRTEPSRTVTRRARGVPCRRLGTERWGAPASCIHAPRTTQELRALLSGSVSTR